MRTEEAVLAAVGALDSLQIPYMIVGAISVSYYGIARSTKDADFVVELGSRSIQEVVQPLGPDFRLEPQMTFETITGTTRQVIRIEKSPFIIEFFYLSNDPHDQARFRRRRSVELLGRTVWLPTVEDVIVTKLRWAWHGGRSKDREDVRDVIAVQEGKIDWDYVHDWCAQHRTRALLDEIRASIPLI